jgi:hypothetical protein
MAVTAQVRVMRLFCVDWMCVSVGLGVCFVCDNFDGVLFCSCSVPVVQCVVVQVSISQLFM